MRVTLTHLRVAIPVIAANAVPLVGVFAYGWSVVELFLLYAIETLVVVFFEAVMMVSRGRDAGELFQGLVNALGAIVIVGSIAASMLWIGVAVVGPRELPTVPTTGDPARDLPAYFRFLHLTIPAAMVGLSQLAVLLSWRREDMAKRTGGTTDLSYGSVVLFTRSFAMFGLCLIVLFASTSAPPGADLGPWAAGVLACMKAATDAYTALSVRPRADTRLR
jgi:hypothetical protein